MMIVKEPGTARPRPGPPGVPGGGDGGGGAASDAIANRRPVLLSNAIVRAPFEGHVFKFCSTSNLVGLFSLTIVSVPLPCVLNASIVAGLNAAPSEPPASGSVVRILPSSALITTIIGCGGCAGGLPDRAHAAKRMRFFTSIARPLQPPLSPNG